MNVRLTKGWIAWIGIVFAGAPIAHTQTFPPEEAVKVSVSGSVRSRVEALSGRMSNAAPASDHFLSLLTLLKAEADFGGVSLVGEIQDSRRLSGPSTGGAPGEVDTLEPIQAYVSWRPSDPGASGQSVGLDLGRFTLDVGSRRLAARSQFRNQKTSFDGLRLIWRSGHGDEVLAFRVSPVVRQPMDVSAAASNKAALNRSDESVVFSGVHLQRTLTDGINGEGYILRIDEQDAADLPSRDRRLTTYGLRLRKAPAKKQFDFDLEWAHQSGQSRATNGALDSLDLTTRASMSHAEIGLTLSAPTSPRLSVHYDFASGDRDPNDSLYGRFDPLFGDRAFEFGPTSLWGVVARSNLKSAGARLEWRPSAASEAYVSLRQVDLSESRDGFSGSGLRDRTGASGKGVGVQLEGRLRWRPAPSGPRLELGAAHLSKGLFLKNAPNADASGDVVYGYSAVTFDF
ncbi:MAG: alginate export family protein [Alphaproteobacteria bacterium]|nr:alginate export family protein [Alphaproteobacteria bacterium]